MRERSQQALREGEATVFTQEEMALLGTDHGHDSCCQVFSLTSVMIYSPPLPCSQTLLANSIPQEMETKGVCNIQT